MFTRNTNFRRLTIFISITVMLLAWQLARWSDALHQQQVASSLQTVLNTTQQALTSWSNAQRKAASLWAQHPDVIDQSQELLALPAISQSLVNLPAQARLKKLLQTVVKENQYKGFAILNPDLRVIASDHAKSIGQQNTLGDQPDFIQKVLSGQTAVSLPTQTAYIISDRHTNRQHNSHPSMFVAAPVMHKKKVIAILAFRIDPFDDFTAILQRGRLSDSGETYAFDRQGILISNSRFDSQLQQMGLLPSGQSSILNISIRNPDDNTGNLSTLINHPALIPLTKMADSAIQGNHSINVKGYNDYRGIKVVGTWLWDKDLNMGITTEIDYDNAYKLLHHTYVVIAIACLMAILLVILLGKYLYNRRLMH